MAHNFAFQPLPKALESRADGAVVVIDEAFWGAGLRGADDAHPIQLPVSRLMSLDTPRCNRADHELIIHYRHRALRAIHACDSGGLMRLAFEREDFTEASADEWSRLEWSLKPHPKLKKGMKREEALELIEQAGREAFTKLLPLLAKHLQGLLKGGDERSAKVALVKDALIDQRTGERGNVIRFRWKEDFAAWCSDLPMLILDASTPVELVRQWAPGVELHKIEMQAPEQHVVQVVDREFGRTFFQGSPNNVRRVTNIISMELASVTGDVLVIAQKVVRLLLEQEVRSRFGGELPPRLFFAHHGAITGLDKHRNAATVISIGRPAMNLRDGEKLAELVKGAAVAPFVADDDCEGNRWPTRRAGIRLANGPARAVDQPYHPDPLVEAVRWAVTDGAVLQAIARGRGVQREAGRPLRVLLLAELALPVTVETVAGWDEIQPNRLAVALAEAFLAGRALPLAPTDLSSIRIDLWETQEAARRFLQEADFPATNGESLIRNILNYKRFTICGGEIERLISAAMRVVRYRKLANPHWVTAIVPNEDGRSALEACVGPLAGYDETGSLGSGQSPSELMSRMVATGRALFSPADMEKAFPDIFPSHRAAERAVAAARAAAAPDDVVEATSRQMVELGMRPAPVAYRPLGRGQQRRDALVSETALSGFRDWLEAALGPLAQYDEPAAATPPTIILAPQSGRPEVRGDTPLVSNDRPSPRSFMPPSRPSRPARPSIPHDGPGTAARHLDTASQQLRRRCEPYSQRHPTPPPPTAALPRPAIPCAGGSKARADE
jgi:putative DNA primase/helicase